MILRLACSLNVALADPFNAGLQREPVKRADGKGGEDGDAIVQHAEGLREGEPPFCFRSCRSCRIRYTPMGGHRLAGPDGARFVRGVVADGEDEIHSWRIGEGEFVPALGARKGRGEVGVLEQIEGEGMEGSTRI